MKKLLITGSAGFVFSNMLLYFLQHTDYDIISVDKLTDAGSLLNIAHNKDVNNRRHRLYLGDISDYHFIKKLFEIEKPDIVINGAASSHVDNSIKDATDFLQTNISGVHSLLEAMRLVHKPELFIQFSTDEVYGQILEGSFDENSSMSPRNPYSATKASGDLLCSSYLHTYNLPIIITRTCNIFGPRQKNEKLIPKCITNLIENKKIGVYGKGIQSREWIFVKDVFYALLEIIKNGKIGEVYNIGSGNEIKNIELVKMILKIMDKEEGSIDFVDDRPGHDFRYALNSDKLKSLGWKNRYDFEEAIKYTVNWYIKNFSWFCK